MAEAIDGVEIEGEDAGRAGRDAQPAALAVLGCDEERPDAAPGG